MNHLLTGVVILTTSDALQYFMVIQDMTVFLSMMSLARTSLPAYYLFSHIHSGLVKMSSSMMVMTVSPFLLLLCSHSLKLHYEKGIMSFVSFACREKPPGESLIIPARSVRRGAYIVPEDTT